MPPIAPIPLRPKDGERTPLCPTFTWRNIEGIEGRNVRMHVRKVGESSYLIDQNFKDYLIPPSSFTSPIRLQGGEDYEWRIGCYHGLGSWGWSDWNTFTTRPRTKQVVCLTTIIDPKTGKKIVTKATETVPADPTEL